MVLLRQRREALQLLRVQLLFYSQVNMLKKKTMLRDHVC